MKNIGLSLNGATAPLMVCIPVIRIAKPSMNFPIFLCTVSFAEHTKNNTNDCDNSRNGCSRKNTSEFHWNPQYKTDTGSIRNTGSDVGSHDDTDRLFQFHHTGVNKTDDHNGRRRRRLDNTGNTSTKCDTLQRSIGHTYKKCLQLITCYKLQAIAHQRHTKQK